MAKALEERVSTAMPVVEQSALGFRWLMREADERAALTLTQQLGISEITARILSARGILPDEAAAFLEPSLKTLLPDPMHLKDMEKAATRLAEAIERRETIGIFGDYDVDGATSSALLYRYLSHFGLETHVHIPDRMTEGYGPNTPALLGLQAKGATLVFTLDCGIMAFEPLAAAKQAGLDVVVLDHHIGEVNLPEAYAVVNPNRFDEESPHGHMAAVGVVFLFIVAVNRLLRARGAASLPDPLQWLDLVALGTVCDVVPLKGVNRAYVSQGLKVAGQRRNAGLRALADVAQLSESPAAYHLGFVLGPRINAGGRVGRSSLGVELLTSQDPLIAEAIARELDGYNDERKTLESIALEEAMAQAEEVKDDAVLLLGGRWHAGVIGIVAGRVKEAFQKPVAVMAFEDDVAKASVRSVAGVDMGSAVVAAKQAGVVLYGGGHAMAAGFTVARDKVEELRNFFNSRLGDAVARYTATKALKLDVELSPQGVNVAVAREFMRMEPFGMGNAAPKVMVSHVKLVKCDVVGNGHMRCIFVDGGVGGKAATGRLQAIAFRAVGTPLETVFAEALRGRLLHLAGAVKLNEWNGQERVDFVVEDAVLA